MSIVRTPATAPLNTIIRSDNANVNRSFEMFLPTPVEKEKVYELSASWSAPDSFTGFQVWKDYLSPIRDQGNCGGCYAFAAVAALADCFNLRSFGKLHLSLSAARVITCDLLNEWNKLIESPQISQSAMTEVYSKYGCGGNTLMEAWIFLYTYGTNKEECFPDSILEKENCWIVSSVQYDRCIDYSPAVFYRAQHVYAIAGVPADKGNESEIRKIIYKFGPVSTAMAIYSDFYTFDTSKIYQRGASAVRLGGHAVVIDGWGEENGVLFWWVRNSWGSKWGINGYFKILRGQNHCDIESNVIAGIPDCVVQISSFFQKRYFQDAIIDPMARRTALSPSNIYGGIDEQTGISRHLLSYTEYANWPNKLKVYSNPEQFFAGLLPNLSQTSKQRSTKIWLIVTLVLIGLFLLIWAFIRFRPVQSKDNHFP